MAKFWNDVESRYEDGSEAAVMVDEDGLPLEADPECPWYNSLDHLCQVCTVRPTVLGHNNKCEQCWTDRALNA